MSDSTITNTNVNNEEIVENKEVAIENKEVAIVNNYWFCNRIYLITGMIATSLIGYGVYRKMNN